MVWAMSTSASVYCYCVPMLCGGTGQLHTIMWLPGRCKPRVSGCKWWHGCASHSWRLAWGLSVLSSAGRLQCSVFLKKPCISQYLCTYAVVPAESTTSEPVWSRCVHPAGVYRALRMWVVAVVLATEEDLVCSSSIISCCGFIALSCCRVETVLVQHLALPLPGCYSQWRQSCSPESMVLCSPAITGAAVLIRL